jgi:hypothetical protein
VEKVVIHVHGLQIRKVTKCRRRFGSVQHVLPDRARGQSGNVAKGIRDWPDQIILSYSEPK